MGYPYGCVWPFFALVIGCIPAWALAVPHYEVTAVTVGQAATEAYGINSFNQVVGFYSDGRSHAFLWHDGAVTNLGSHGGSTSIAFGINDSGQVVGWATHADSPYYPFMWEDGVMTGLETLGGHGGANGINAAGDVVGMSVLADGSANHGFLWRNGVLTDLGAFRGNSVAYAINNSGHVVGDAGIPGLGFQPVLWNDGTIRQLTALGGATGNAFDINDDGLIVGAVNIGTGEIHAILWREGVPIDLSTLGGPSSIARAINSSGWIVGESDTAGGHAASLWIEETPYNLNDLIPSGSGWELLGATDINDHGAIVGTGNYQGARTAFLLTPVATISEPNSLMLVLSGILIVAGFRWCNTLCTS